MGSLRKKILVIDDDEAVFGYLKTKIGFLYDLVTTVEPAMALDIAMREDPDLVLCDIDMPGLDGGDLSARFMGCSYTRKIPFAYLTSFVSPEEIRDLGGNVGGRFGISKATPAPEMIEAIERLVR